MFLSIFFRLLKKYNQNNNQILSLTPLGPMRHICKPEVIKLILCRTADNKEINGQKIARKETTEFIKPGKI